MSRRQVSVKNPATHATRCAIYTRKSSDDGLQQEFNSLDAQREGAEAYIASQKNEGWLCLPDRYDDGGFTGGNTDRPALRRLMADIEAGKVDTVVVYKIDRFSRSLADFMRMMTVFEQHGVAFVSVTQAFDTSSSMGRLTLNILLSFAQFEREIIGERIRDKITASRQRGKWTGGTPVLGYDIDRSGPSPKLVVNPAEAARVAEIFELYIELGALLPAVAELARRGWCCKAWTTRDGRPRGGLPFDKCRLHDLLTNPIYIGQIRHKDAVHAGEHEAIVPADLFDRVQQQLRQHGQRASRDLRNKHGALLRGLLFCKACSRAMPHTFTTSGTQRYRYYCCTARAKRGAASCPTRALPAAAIERVVVDELRALAGDADLRRETLAQATAQNEASIRRLTSERSALLRRPTTEPEIRQRRIAEIDAAVAALRAERLEASDVDAAFDDFDGLWASLSPREQCRIVHLLVQRIEFDGRADSVDITFAPAGIKSLAQGNVEEDAA